MSIGALHSSDIFLESQRLQCHVLAQDRPDKALSSLLWLTLRFSIRRKVKAKPELAVN